MNTESVTSNEFEGYGLFNDIDNKELQTLNRAKSMANIFEQFSTDDGMSDEGLNLVQGYYGEIPEDERGDVFVALLGQLDERKIPYYLEQLH